MVPVNRIVRRYVKLSPSQKAGGDDKCLSSKEQKKRPCYVACFLLKLIDQDLRNFKLSNKVGLDSDDVM